MPRRSERPEAKTGLKPGLDPSFPVVSLRLILNIRNGSKTMQEGEVYRNRV